MVLHPIPCSDVLPNTAQLSCHTPELFMLEGPGSACDWLWLGWLVASLPSSKPVVQKSVHDDSKALSVPQHGLLHAKTPA